MLPQRAETRPGPEREAFELATLMENAAARQEWARAEKLALQVRNALLRVPEPDRAAVASELSQVVDRIRTSALTSRAEVIARLSEIRRGRVAQRAYAQPQAANDGV